jgi:L-lactate utilization protein LutB
MRQEAVADLNGLEQRLVETLHGLPQVEVVVADDVQRAAEAIRQCSAAGSTIAINQSSVVIQEVAPVLRQTGFQVVDSYSGEFPDIENRFTGYHQLPRATSDHLVESFAGSDLARLRSASIETGGVQDFVALLGVNSISADDGTVFLLQHSQNISRVFQQARKLVLLVAIDKIVPTREEARLQTLGMGVFGWEARLLNLGKNGGDARLAASPSLPSTQAHSDILVIVMDNGRRRLLDGLYRDLLLCIGCRACVRSCPTYRFMAEKDGWSPKEYLYYFVQRRNPSLELCLSCGMCRIECPLDIDLPDMIMTARQERWPGRGADRAGLMDPERLGRWGSRMPGLANLALGNPVSRWFADRALGISRDAPLPRFRGDTLARWFRVRPGARGR